VLGCSGDRTAVGLALGDSPPRRTPGGGGPLTRDPGEDLRAIAFCLERALEPSYRVKAFRTAAKTVDEVGRDELQSRADAGSLEELPGIGKVTALVITESLAGEEPNYLRRVATLGETSVSEGALALRDALQGDCHVHSDWSDGGSPIREMAEAARALGHSYMVLTDHSPRLTVARGLSPERLREQLDVVARLNDELADEASAGKPPFRILTGIECDIHEDGSLDQEPELLARLDLVVASVHSKLRMPSAEMTPRMVAAISNPHTDVLGHCTGRMVKGKGRPESEFEAEIVFAACAQFDVAVEVNSRPERLDPPKRLLRLAIEAGCKVAIDTDAHAPGQLSWQHLGCERAHLTGVTADRVVNAWSADELLAWTNRAS
jgi:putative hydrolase